MALFPNDETRKSGGPGLSSTVITDRFPQPSFPNPTASSSSLTLFRLTSCTSYPTSIPRFGRFLFSPSSSTHALHTAWLDRYPHLAHWPMTCFGRAFFLGPPVRWARGIFWPLVDVEVVDTEEGGGGGGGVDVDVDVGLEGLEEEGRVISVSSSSSAARSSDASCRSTLAMLFPTALPHPTSSSSATPSDAFVLLLPHAPPHPSSLPGTSRAMSSPERTTSRMALGRTRSRFLIRARALPRKASGE